MDIDFLLGGPFYVAKMHFSADPVHGSALLYFCVLLQTGSALTAVYFR